MKYHVPMMVMISIVLIDDMNPFVHAVESEIYDYHSTRSP